MDKNEVQPRGPSQCSKDNGHIKRTGCLNFTLLAPYSAVSALTPLILVMGVSMVKETIEDWKRKMQISGGWRHTMAITSDGKLYGWGWNKPSLIHWSC
ncbi:uncharacterized protein LOC131248708 [Magnolia sinica]|uniref:uncharacterized protein LOC131248708 n=1 Tax=Magnolia sinica TaxID=86752 RepID=UPI0026584268|nr:uncharacterized protein LOC131248708 [Magnolia sinica]